MPEGPPFKPPPGGGVPGDPPGDDPEGQPIDPPEGVTGGGTPVGPAVGTAGGPLATGTAIGGGEAGGGGPGRPIAGEEIFRAGEPIGGRASLFNIGGAPVNAGSYFIAGSSVQAPGAFTAGNPVGGPASIFNIGGAPIAVLGGVFSAGLPIGGPVTQIFRGGSGPQPNTLFINTITPGGPIASFFIGSGGSPIGVDVFQGGGLPIGPSEIVVVAVQALQARTALFASAAEAFGGGEAAGPVPPIGPGAIGTRGAPIGGGGGGGG